MIVDDHLKSFEIIILAVGRCNSMMMIFRGTDIEQDNNVLIFVPERIVVCLW